MNRVLVTGGAGTIGAAVVRRLLRDPDYEVRVSDQREAPQWMREGCEVHTGDLRLLDEARTATQGCSHVIHLAAIVGGIANFHKLPHTLTEVNNALYNAIFRAALDEDVERFQAAWKASRCEVCFAHDIYLTRLGTRDRACRWPPGCLRCGRTGVRPRPPARFPPP